MEELGYRHKPVHLVDYSVICTISLPPPAEAPKSDIEYVPGPAARAICLISGTKDTTCQTPQYFNLDATYRHPTRKRTDVLMLEGLRLSSSASRSGMHGIRFPTASPMRGDKSKHSPAFGTRARASIGVEKPHDERREAPWAAAVGSSEAKVMHIPDSNQTGRSMAPRHRYPSFRSGCCQDACLG